MLTGYSSNPDKGDSGHQFEDTALGFVDGMEVSGERRGVKVDPKAF